MILTLAEQSFGWIAWSIVAAYMLIVVLIGWTVSRRGVRGIRGRGRDDLLLANRSMPMWAVAISVLATSQSAATFVGGPQEAFDHDLTYLSANIGALIAVVIVACIFIPAYYRHNVTSVYELIGHRFGGSAQRLASGMFLLGRIFASGARLFMVAIPFSWIAFGDIEHAHLIAAILIIAAGATAYTMIGGIRAVIWTDVLQAAVYIGSIIIALVILWNKLDIEWADLLTTLNEHDKLNFIDAELNSLDDFGKRWSLWGILFGLTLFNIAAFGCDQDLTQRMLTCKSARSGAWSVVLSNIIGWPVILLFLSMGLLLFVFYEGSSGGGGDSRKVFLRFILEETPVPVRGLMMAGLFAAAMSSLDSALNAMASTTVADFYRPLRSRGERESGSRGVKQARSTPPLPDSLTPPLPDSPTPPPAERTVIRAAICTWAVLLAGFASLCVFWQEKSGQTLISFALGVMVFAYSGLLAVFLTAILTKRGNAWSAAAALATGFIITLILQGFIWKGWLGIDFALAFPWKMLIATMLAFGVCCFGRRSEVSGQRSAV